MRFEENSCRVTALSQSGTWWRGGNHRSGAGRRRALGRVRGGGVPSPTRAAVIDRSTNAWPWGIQGQGFFEPGTARVQLLGGGGGGVTHEDE